MNSQIKDIENVNYFFSHSVLHNYADKLRQTIRKWLSYNDLESPFVHHQGKDWVCVSGGTPLMEAIARNNDDVVEVLLQYGASPNTVIHGNMTAWKVATDKHSFPNSIGYHPILRQQKRERILELLILHGCSDSESESHPSRSKIQNKLFQIIVGKQDSKQENREDDDEPFILPFPQAGDIHFFTKLLLNTSCRH